MSLNRIKNFVHDNKLESHWGSYRWGLTLKCELFLHVPTFLISSFQKALELDSLNSKTIECTVSEDSFSFEMYDFLLNHYDCTHTDIVSIFPELDNNI